ncbi:MAG TPA: termination factor Rho [Nevskia sp.]|nr:termination factor Rho [Nevskia sp.]
MTDAREGTWTRRRDLKIIEPKEGADMPRGEKTRYSDKQKRKARHIEKSYESRGVDEKEAAARAWATVNKQSGGGEKSGSGRKTSSRRKRAARKDSARRGTATKRGHSPNRGRASARRSHGRRTTRKTARSR